MRFWQPVMWAETEQLVEIAKFAEELGFYGVLGADHAFYPQQMRPDYPYDTSGRPPQVADSEYPDCWVTIAAMAAVTTRLRFTTGIYVLPLRNPIELAKATATLAIISQGRFILGAGSGWMREEFDVYGVDFATRGRRLTETVEVLQKLWQGGMVEHHGEFFDFPMLQIAPKPSHTIQIYFGGDAPLALKRCARYGDGWIGAGNHLHEVAPLLKTLHDLRLEQGREHLPFDTLVGVRAQPTAALYRQLADIGVTSSLASPFPFVLGKRSSLDAKKRVMEKFANDVICQYP